MSEHNWLGKRTVKPDARSKVTGEAKYTDDIQLEGMLQVRTLRSPYPNARVTNIDASRARAMPGVHAVLTPDNDPGVLIADLGTPDRYLLTDSPRAVGDAIAAVAAEDTSTAAEAAAAIKVEFEEQPFVLDPEVAAQPNAPKAHPDGNAQTVTGPKEITEGEIPGKLSLEIGNPDAGFSDADRVFERIIETPFDPGNCLEPRTYILSWRNGKLYQWEPTQNVSAASSSASGYLGIDEADFVEIAPFTGGAFGTRHTFKPQAAIGALLAAKTNRPVKISLTRKEETYRIGGRNPEKVRMKIGVKEDGTITAIEAHAQQDGGAAADVSPGVVGSMLNTIISSFQCYKGEDQENIRISGYTVYTNKPFSSLLRSPNQSAGALIIGRMMDQIAKEMGFDPYEFMHQNAISTGDPFELDRIPVSTCLLPEALEQVKDEFNWDERKRKSGTLDGDELIGVGIGVGEHTSAGSGYDGIVQVDLDGRVHVRSGISNLGTHSHTPPAMIAAEVLNLKKTDEVGSYLDDTSDALVVHWGDDREGPYGPSQGGSKTMFSQGHPTMMAAQKLKANFLDLAAGELDEDQDALEMRNREVIGETGRMGFRELARLAEERGGKYVGDEDIEGLHSQTKRVVEKLEGAIGVAHHERTRSGSYEDSEEESAERPVVSYAASAAEVRVDVDTGQVRVTDLVSVADCGTVIDPDGVEAQIIGGNIQGLGYVLFTDEEYDPATGTAVNFNFKGTKPPSFLDQPAQTGYGLDEPEELGPMGAKGLGEPPYGAGAASVANAVADAAGADFTEFPVRPETVLAALSEQSR